MSDMRRFWEPIDPEDPDQWWTPPPPATPAEIRAWEAEHSVRLPARYAEALAIQNGGRVRGTMSFDLSPLSEIESLVGERFEGMYREWDEEGAEVPGRDRMFSIGSESGCDIILDYRGKAEPGILILEHDMGRRLSAIGVASFDDLLRGRGDEAPG